MDTLRIGLSAAGLAVVLGGSLVSRQPEPSALSASFAVDAAATPVADQGAAQVSDLQTRVADLSTRVAELGGAEEEALVGRLGGSRSGFDARYGPPVAFLGGGAVQYDVPDTGRLTVTFEADVAQRAMLVSSRPASLPLEEPDEADWSLERAREVAATIVPADATFDVTGTDEPNVLTGASAALSGAVAVDDEQGCEPTGGRGFTVTYTMPNPDLVSAIEIELGAEQAALAPTEPDRSGRTQRGASAVANSSLGGVVAVNGLRMQAFDVVEDAEAEQPAAEGQTLVAVELAIENDGRRSVAFAPTDFVLVDASGEEVTALCGGVEPSIGQVEVGRRDAAEGFVTFQVPEGFVPERFVVLAPGARVGFELG